MDAYTSYSDPQPFGSDPSSDGARVSLSDGEGSIMLASRNPKRKAGRKKFRETRHPVYRGVRRRNSGKWVCEVREPKKKSRIWLGTFATVEMAARAHDVAVLALRGRSACLNFADSAWRLPVPASSDTKDIQRAALEAAEAFGTCQLDGDKADEVEERAEVADRVVYVDEESLFEMPMLLENMAEGMLLPPPPLHSLYAYVANDVEFDADMSLWSYSI